MATSPRRAQLIPFQARHRGPFLMEMDVNKELLRMVELVALEKGLPQHAIIECLEKSMAGLCRKGLEAGARVRVELGGEHRSFCAWRVWDVVADDVRLEDPAYQMRLMDAQEMGYGNVKVGDQVEEPLPAPTLSRVAARSLYQQLIGNVRQAERDLARQAWQCRVGELVYGTVKRVLAGRVILDVEGTEASLARSDQIVGERLRVGARVAVVIRALNDEGRGAPLIADRRSEALLEQLLAQEVPEVRTGMVKVRAVARDGRGRAKVAVESLNPRVDAVAACVGMRGARIQAVAKALADERIHLMSWCEDPVEMVSRALAPIRAVRAVVDESRHTMDVAVSDEDVGRACGRWNTNALLISKLTGWQVGIMGEQELMLKQAEELALAEVALIQQLDVDEALANALASEGFTDVESVACCAIEDLTAIEGVDEDMAHELQARASAQAVARAVEGLDIDDALWVSLDPSLREALRSAGVEGSQALAECAVDEIQGVGGLTQEHAAALILEARKPWLEKLAQAS